MCLNTNIYQILASLPLFSACNLVSLESEFIRNLLIRELGQSGFTLWGSQGLEGVTYLCCPS